MCRFCGVCASVLELVPGIARHVIMNRHSTCISMCIMKHVLKQKKASICKCHISYGEPFDGWSQLAEVPQKMLSGARACTMPSAACHPSSPAFSCILPCHTGQGFLPHDTKPESTILLDQAFIQQTDHI